jgi:tRNA-2-methylthio-N6-dimethylallyladenosine synthase
MKSDVIAAMAETPSVCEHLHYPLQSGSDRVLALMHRGYTAQRYLERLAEARAAMPDIAITTDIIVGFPGETEEDFVRTLEVAAEANFDSTYTFIFSPRDGTEAATMTEHFVDPGVIADRFERLRVVVERSALLLHEARAGRVEEIVVEGPNRKREGHFTGRTRQNKLVHFASRQALRPGTYGTVEITRGAPHFLEGVFREVLAEPTHRVRIPVAVAGH